MEPILNIIHHGSTYGHFVKMFVDIYSTKTPDRVTPIFNTVGTAHKSDESGMVVRTHDTEYRNSGPMPICMITPSTEKHFMFLKTANWFRSGDRSISPDVLWDTAVGEMPELVRPCAESIIGLYGMEDMAHFSWIPKFLVRDWFKLGYLRPLEENDDFKTNKRMREDKDLERHNVFHMDLEAMFDWQVFLDTFKRMDSQLSLGLDFGRQKEMERVWRQGYSLDRSRQQAQLAADVIDDLEGSQSLQTQDLDVNTQAFIYAEIEKRYPEIQMPLTNRFFRDSQEIKQYLEHYPNFYRRKNPNL